MEAARREFEHQSQLLAEIAARSAKARASAQLEQERHHRLMALISHDLRTPLNAVIGFSDVMQKELFGPLGHGRYRDYVGHIQESGQKLLKAAEDIMTMKRVETQQIPMAQDEFDLDELLREVRRLILPKTDAAGIVCEKIQVPPLLVRTDRRALRQALHNLSVEVLSALPRGGEISLAARLDRGGLAIEINALAPIEQREGPICWIGLPDGPSHIDRLEERSESLGRAVTSSLIELLGGRLETTSAPIIGCFAAICVLPAEIGTRDMQERSAEPCAA